MADPPRLHETRCQMGRSEKRRAEGFQKGTMRADLKTWPATPVGASLAYAWRVRLRLVESCFFVQKGAAGVGQPSESWNESTVSALARDD